MAKTNKAKPLVELDKPGGKVMAYWESAKAAADFYKFPNQVSISYNVNGTTKQARGHYFRYATDKETEAYQQAMQRIDAVTDPKPVAPEPVKEILPVEVIPEVVQKPDAHEDALSPFDKLLQKSKKNFNNNSD